MECSVLKTIPECVINKDDDKYHKNYHVFFNNMYNLTYNTYSEVLQ